MGGWTLAENRQTMCQTEENRRRGKLGNYTRQDWRKSAEDRERGKCRTWESRIIESDYAGNQRIREYENLREPH